MKRSHRARSAALRRLCLLGCVMVGFAGVFGQPLRPSPTWAQAQLLTSDDPQTETYVTTYNYVVNFYPLWFTYYQSALGNSNRFIGPDCISPLYQAVVAINDDTLYGSTFLHLEVQPLVVTVPSTLATYSVLAVDAFGNAYDVGIPKGNNYPAVNPAGSFVLYGPDYQGPLPPELTPIAMPFNFMFFVFRVDKFAPDGTNLMAQAQVFRGALATQPLCGYLGTTCPSGTESAQRTTLILPQIDFSEPFKTAADALLATDPVAFLRQLQVAVLSSNTPPLSPYEQALSDRFNAMFDGGYVGKNSEFARGAQAAHAAILNNYLTHLGPNFWIHFTNIAAWGDQVLDRASITEFIQYGNSIQTAAYYHAFRDNLDRELNGTNPNGYVLTFPAGQLPPVERFWSLTAYTPEAIELVDNPINKYVIGSYTPGLTYNPDNSLSLYLATKPPVGAPRANWLPVPEGKFNVMLRIYGVVPNSNVANNTYVPPAILRRE